MIADEPCQYAALRFRRIGVSELPTVCSRRSRYTGVPDTLVCSQRALTVMRESWICLLLFLLLGSAGRTQAQSLDGAWKQNGLAERRFIVNGTAGRNNPLRRPLQKP